MKALKEKRISLRSLWRRGLVILSLFALVFVSCGDSDSGSNSGGTSSSTPPPKKVIAQVIDFTPPNKDGAPITQYMGRPIDLTGASAMVKYTDGTTGTISGEGNFSAFPRLATGYYQRDASGRDQFVGYNFTYISCNGVGPDVFQMRYDFTTVGIARLNPADNSGPDLYIGPQDLGSYSATLHLTGYENVYTKPVYVDDDEFDFDGLLLAATYLDGKIWYLNFSDVTWRILPYYVADPNDDKVYGGYVQITVGADIYNYAALSGQGTNGHRDGITTYAPLETVYTVKKIELPAGADPLADPEFGIMYWDPNTPRAWAAKLGDTLLVTYTDGQPAHEKKITGRDGLIGRTDIWYNANPGVVGATNTTNPQWPYFRDPDDIDTDFYVMPVDYPLDKKKPQTSITVYYRGRTLKLPVSVYTNFLGLQQDALVVYNAIDDIRDNDNPNSPVIPGGSAAALASQMKINATYGSYPSSAVQKTDVKLDYNPTRTDGGFYNIPNYPDVYNKIKTDGEVRAVKITHTVNVPDVETKLIGLDRDFNAGDLAVVKSVNKSTNQDVEWYKFNKKPKE